jgi:homoserine dehydrogenase
MLVSQVWAKFETATQIRIRVLPTELQQSTAYFSVAGYNNNFLIITEYFIEKYVQLHKFTGKTETLAHCNIDFVLQALRIGHKGHRNSITFPNVVRQRKPV